MELTLTDSTIRYLNDTYKGQGHVSYTKETSKTLTAQFNVSVADGRELPNDGVAQLREKGFVLVPFVTSVHADLGHIENPDHYKTETQLQTPETEVGRFAREQYWRECEELTKEYTGAPHCFVIGHAVRKGNDNASDGVGYLTAYATFAHCDYTKEIAEDAADKMLLKRIPGITLREAAEFEVGFYNIWQPTNAPVHQNPLAMLDFNTVDPSDVMNVELGYAVTPTNGGKVKAAPMIAQLTHRPEHQ